MHNLHNTTTGALFAHMLLLNCNLHFLHIAFKQRSKWYAQILHLLLLTRKKYVLLLNLYVIPYYLWNLYFFVFLPQQQPL